MNYYGQNTENQKEQEQKYYTPLSNTSTSTTTKTRSRAFSEEDILDREEQLTEIGQRYRENIGEMPLALAAYIERLFDKGMEKDVFIEVIEKTTWAPRPSAAYMRAILSRYESDRIFTIPQLLADERDYERKKNQWWKSR